MEESWRQVFSSKNQNVLVELLVHDFFSALKFLYDQNELTRLVYEELLREIQGIRGKDLTVAFKLLGKRFYRISSDRPASLRINLQALFFEQKALRKDWNILEKIESHSVRLKTTDPIFTLLKEARNLDAHDLSEQSTGWNVLVLASVQHLLAVSEVNKKYIDDAKLLNAFVCDTLGRLHQETPVDNREQIGGGESDVGPTAELLDEIRQIKGILEISSPESEAALVAPETRSLSEAEFESALVELRYRVVQAYACDDWPGPMANLFQKSFVSEVLQYKPKNLAEAVRLPDVAWRITQNRELIKKQMIQFGREFDDLISSVKWEEDDIF
jgi:hypothetical protein